VLEPGRNERSVSSHCAELDRTFADFMVKPSSPPAWTVSRQSQLLASTHPQPLKLQRLLPQPLKCTRRTLLWLVHPTPPRPAACGFVRWHSARVAFERWSLQLVLVCILVARGSTSRSAEIECNSNRHLVSGQLQAVCFCGVCNNTSASCITTFPPWHWRLSGSGVAVLSERRALLKN
jgi:hypothetical protein